MYIERKVSNSRIIALTNTLRKVNLDIIVFLLGLCDNGKSYNYLDKS